MMKAKISGLNATPFGVVWSPSSRGRLATPLSTVKPLATSCPRFPGAQANTLAELAHQLGLNTECLTHTVTEYNNACQPGQFNHTILDNCTTKALTPRRHTGRDHWTSRLTTAMPCGRITFTYLGLKVNERAAVHFAGQPSRNLFVAGEMMAGNVLGKGYTAGVGMSIGTTFGRIAGKRPRWPHVRRLVMRQLEKLIIDAQIITEPEAEVERVMQVCNACRYCEGFCAVFPAMTLRPNSVKRISIIWRTCAITAVPACTPVSMPRLMSLPSTCRRRWRKSGLKPISTTRNLPPLARFIVVQALP